MRGNLEGEFKQLLEKYLEMLPEDVNKTWTMKILKKWYKEDKEDAKE